MTSGEAVSESMEDYLKAIFSVIAKQQVARPKDILKILKVSAPSVTGALHALAEREFIHYSPHDLITLTEKGERAARDVVRRHDVILNFFEKILLVDPKEAEEVACRMEHAISPNVMERFIRFVEFLDLCPRAGEKWISGFGYYCDQDGKLDNCETCISQTLEEVRKKKREGGAIEEGWGSIKRITTRQQGAGGQGIHYWRYRPQDGRNGRDVRKHDRGRADSAPRRSDRHQSQGVPSDAAQG